MAYTTTAGEEVGRSEANRLANLELQTAFDDLTARGLHKQAYDLIQRGSIEAPVQVASAAPVNGLLSSLGLNSSDTNTFQGLLAQFRRAEEERQFADAGHQDHEDGPGVSMGGGYNYNPGSAAETDYLNMDAADRQKIIDAGKNANVLGSGVKGLFSLATRVPIGGPSFFDEFGKYRAGQKMESMDEFYKEMRNRNAIDPDSEAARLQFMNSRGGLDKDILDSAATAADFVNRFNEVGPHGVGNTGFRTGDGPIGSGDPVANAADFLTRGLISSDFNLEDFKRAASQSFPAAVAAAAIPQVQQVRNEPTASSGGVYTSDHGGLYDRDEYDHAPEMDLW